MDVRRLIREIHRRSLWQVMAIYLGSSWVVLQVTQHVVSQFHLPEWTYGAALMLLLLGLPIVLATAFVQEGGPRSDPPPAARPERVASPRRPSASDDDWSHRMLTWRNAFVGAVGAMALWGVVAAGWLLVAPSQGREAQPAGREPAGLRALDTVAEDTVRTALGSGGAEVPESTAANPSTDPASADAGEPRPTAGTGDAEPRTAADSPDSGPVRMATPRADSTPSRTDRPTPIRGTAEEDAAERTRREHGDLLQAALAASARAREAGAPERGFDLTVADSLVEEGRRPTGAEGVSRALRDLAGAQALYDDAARRAERGWRASADSAAVAVEALRKGAEEGAPGYAEGELHRSEGRHAVRTGDFRAAVDRYREAADDFERAAVAEATPARPTTAVESAAAAGVDEEAGADENAAEGRAEPDLAEVRAAVTATLDRLERALESEDVAAIRKVWVTMDGETERGFRSFFEGIRDFDVTIAVRWETLAASTARATVTAVTTWAYFDEERRQIVRREPFEQGFELVHRDSAWVLVRY